MIPPTPEQQSYLHSPLLFFILKLSSVAKSQPILPKAARCQIVCGEAEDSPPENSPTVIAVTATGRRFFVFKLSSYTLEVLL